MADTPKNPVNPKTAAIGALIIALLAAVMLYFPNTATYLKPLCQAFGGCQENAIDSVPVSQ